MKVSVIIPLYNAENYIATCLESILNQTLHDFEVIIVNDCSTDNSVAIAETFFREIRRTFKNYLPANQYRQRFNPTQWKLKILSRRLYFFHGQFWLDPLVKGLDYLNDFMSGDFFYQNPNFRFDVTNFFVKMQLAGMLAALKNLNRYQLYQIICESFSDSKYAPLIAY